MDKEAKKRYNEYVETVTPTHNLLSQIFKIAGPVVLYGVLSSWILGLIYWIVKMING